MRSRGLLAGLLLAASAATLPSAADEDEHPRKARIVDLEIDRASTELEVSFRLTGAFTPELNEKIRAGISVTFRHRVEVFQRRVLGLWPSRTVASTRVETTVGYDSLTHRYELRRTIESSSRGQPRADRDEQRRSTVSEDEMRAWMTELAMIPPLDLATLSAGESARLRVESTLGRRWFLLVPTRRTVSVDRKLEH